jgi:hypothetical protein
VSALTRHGKSKQCSGSNQPQKFYHLHLFLQTSSDVTSAAIDLDRIKSGCRDADRKQKRTT